MGSDGRGTRKTRKPKCPKCHDSGYVFAYTLPGWKGKKGAYGAYTRVPCVRHGCQAGAKARKTTTTKEDHEA